ncbi:MAG: Slp family lipoprotein [Gammaproteobacteria bacterium]
MLRFNLLVILLMLLSACASSPGIDSSGVDRSLTPQGVAVQPQMAGGKQVLWGGVIIQTTNLSDRTQVEVLAYPLDASQRPQSGLDAQGRFIFEQTGFLDPASYAGGRLITVAGTVTGTRAGRVGESNYSYPVVSGRQHNLWPKESGGSGINFGIGVGTWF